MKRHRISTGLDPSSSGVVAPREAGDARENGDEDALGDGVEQLRWSVKLAGSWFLATLIGWSEPEVVSD